MALTTPPMLLMMIVGIGFRITKLMTNKHIII